MTNVTAFGRVTALVALLTAACGGGASGGGGESDPDEAGRLQFGPPPAEDAGEIDSPQEKTSFVPAKHPALPQVISYGGPVLANPKIQLVGYTSDPNLADMEAFAEELTHTTFWSDTTSEYGVGALEILPPIAITDPPPASITDAALQAEIATGTSGANPPWGPADASTIYLMVLPPGTVEADKQGACCAGYDGYHSEAMVGSVSVPYAVSCACHGFDGPDITDVEERTVNASHELVEAATEPFPYSNPAYGREDDDDIVWTLTTVGEVGDMCEFNNDAYYVPPGATYMIQRTWSNAAARLTLNPCVPQTLSTAPYFNAAPALQAVAYPLPSGGSIATRGLTIPFGQSQTIDVVLFSDTSMPGPWKVTAYDFGYLLGGPTNLDLSLDKNSGQNGDTLHLTIRAVSSNSDIAGEAFILYSEYGSPGTAQYQNNLAMGLVLN